MRGVGSIPGGRRGAIVLAAFLAAVMLGVAWAPSLSSPASTASEPPAAGPATDASADPATTGTAEPTGVPTVTPGQPPVATPAPDDGVTGTPGVDLSDYASAGTAGADDRHPGHDPCPGAPGEGPMQRRPDTAKDADGNLHMVWSERFDGQWDVCYAHKPGEMGLGNGRNPAVRLTNSSTDSTDPRIAIDEASDLIYVVWTEHLPGDALDSPEIGDEVLVVFASVALRGEFLWTPPQRFADGACRVNRFDVHESDWEFVFRGIGTTPGCPRTASGVMDTDGDGLLDHIEVLGRLGNVTAWWAPDTDGDLIWDPDEITAKLDPTIPVQLEHPECFPRGKDPICVVIVDLICLVFDADGDGFSACAEAGAHPVTTEVVGFRHPSFAEYRFWPKVNGVHDVRVRMQQRTYFAPSGCNNVTVAASTGGVAIGSVTRAWNDASPPWTQEVLGSVNLTGIDGTAHTAAMALDLRLDVTFDPPTCAQPILLVPVELAVDWIKVERQSDRSEVNYKDADDTTSRSGPSQASVQTEDMDIALDPAQRDFLLELDSMADHPWDATVLNELINAYSDIDIILNYKVDETGLSHAGALSQLDPGDLDDADEVSQYLEDHRNAALGAYLHVMNVHYLSRTSCTAANFHYGSAENAGVGDDPEYAGVVLGDECLLDQFDGVTTTAGQPHPDLVYRRVGNMLHEIGHAMNAAHDTSTGTVDAVIDGAFDTTNCFNVMTRTVSCPSFQTKMLGNGNNDRRFGASQAIGFPRWSRESVAQFDLTSLLSVHTGYNYDLLGNFT